MEPEQSHSWEQTCNQNDRQDQGLYSQMRFLIALGFSFLSLGNCTEKCIKTHTVEVFSTCLQFQFGFVYLFMPFFISSSSSSSSSCSFCMLKFLQRCQSSIRCAHQATCCATLRILVNQLKCLQEGLSHPLNTHTRTGTTHTHTLKHSHTTCFLTINDRTKFETFATASYIIAHWPRPPLPPPFPACLPRPHSPAASVAKFTPNFIKIPISAYTQLQGKGNGSGEGKGNSCLAGTASPCHAHTPSI